MNIKKTLDRLYSSFDFESRAARDPIEFPHGFKRKRDIETVALISALFAYGRVDLFKAVLRKIFSIMGNNPYGFIMDFDAKKHGGLFSGIRYRFYTTDDILGLFSALSAILKEHDGIEALFMKHYNTDDPHIGPGLMGFADYATGVYIAAAYGKNARTGRFPHFFPSPAGSSPCKRLNLFLRWMVRDRDIDFGIWKGISKNKLIIPLDTHIARTAKCLGFTKRTSRDWKTAVEITQTLKTLDPDDPLKYDFALCHLGISGICRPDGGNCNRCGLIKPKRNMRMRVRDRKPGR